MFEFVTAFFVGLAVWEMFVLGLAFLLVGVSFNKESGSMFAIAVGAIAFYFLKLDFNLVTIGSYLAIGFGWMIFKFRRHAYETIENYKEINIRNKAKGADTYSEAEVKKRIFSEADADAVFYWIVAWPASMIGFALYDFSKYVYEQIKVMLSNIVDNMMLKAGFAETVQVPKTRSKQSEDE